MSNLPAPPRTTDALEELLSRPDAPLIESLSRLDGDLVLLGVGGKMGPTMARMAVRALRESGSGRRVIGVSRFSSPGLRERLESWGVATQPCDLLDERQVAELPDAAHVISMSGFKFGASESPELAWGTNCVAPVHICRRYAGSRIVAFSTGNVYGLTTPASGGSREDDAPGPIGEYAMSALGRERVFQFLSRQHRLPVVLLRLNYATELRYGVLVDLARSVHEGRPVSLGMGHVNVIWLADANRMTLRALTLPGDGCRVLNLAGPEILRVREVCDELARRLGTSWTPVGEEAPTALLNNGHAAYPLLGAPQVGAAEMIAWTADWVARGGESLGRPTHFEVQDGGF